VTRESNRGLAIRYEYDQNGNRTLMVDPSGGRFTTLYGAVDAPLRPRVTFETSALESGKATHIQRSRAEPQADSGCPNGTTNACGRTIGHAQRADSRLTNPSLRAKRHR